jgi:CheY-like chemotaxis protein
MESNTLCRRKPCAWAPAELTVVALYNGSPITLCTEYVGTDGVTLFAQEYVRPRAVFEALIWIPITQSGEQPNRRPLRVFLSVQLVERTAAGYGISAKFSGIATEDRKEWEHMVEGAMSRAGRALARAQRSLRLRNAQDARNLQRPTRRRVLVVEQALPATALAAMAERGMHVTKVRSADEVRRAVHAGEADLLLCDVAGLVGDGLALCRELGGQAGRPAVILLTSRGAQEDFDQAVEAGAARVIAKPCSHDVLLSLLQRELEPESVQLRVSLRAARPSRAPASAGEMAGPMQVRASAA